MLRQGGATVGRGARLGVGGFLWYPVLLPLWPISAVYVANSSEVSWPEIARPALAAVAAAAACFLLAARVWRNHHKAGLACGAWWLWVLGWGHVEHLLGRWPSLLILYLSAVIAVWVCCLLAVWLLIIRSRRPLHSLSRGANSAVLLLVVWQALPVARCAWRDNGPSHPPPTPAPPPAVGAAAGLPSIYYIVLDSYGRQDVLRHLYGYDNEPFLRSLESRGFHVARQARANYCHTGASQTSTLECRHLAQAAQASGGQPAPNRALPVEPYLRQRGYRVVLRSFSDSPKGTASGKAPSAPLLGSFEQKLLAMTVLPALLPPQPPTRPGRGQAAAPRAFGMNVGRLGQAGVWATLPLLQGLGDEVGSQTQPLFLRTHLLCPHPPFVFPPVPGGQNRYVLNQEVEEGDSRGGSNRDYVRGYRSQLAYLNSRLVPAIDRLLAKAGPNAIVILQGDHGPASRVCWQRPAESLMKERFGILLAVRLPPGPRPALTQEMTPVNLFPTLLRHYLGCELPPRAEESYFTTPTGGGCIRVTDAVRADGWRLGYPGHWGPEVPPAR